MRGKGVKEGTRGKMIRVRGRKRKKREMTHVRKKGETREKMTRMRGERAGEGREGGVKKNSVEIICEIVRKGKKELK